MPPTTCLLCMGLFSMVLFWEQDRRSQRRSLSNQFLLRFTLEPGVDAIDHLAVVISKTVFGDVAEMRRQHEVFDFAERMVDRQRLDRKDVDAGAGDLLVGQRFQ